MNWILIYGYGFLIAFIVEIWGHYESSRSSNKVLGFAFVAALLWPVIMPARVLSRFIYGGK